MKVLGKRKHGYIVRLSDAELSDIQEKFDVPSGEIQQDNYIDLSNLGGE